MVEKGDQICPSWATRKKKVVETKGNVAIDLVRILGADTVETLVLFLKDIVGEQWGKLVEDDVEQELGKSG